MSALEIFGLVCMWIFGIFGLLIFLCLIGELIMRKMIGPQRLLEFWSWKADFDNRERPATHQGDADGQE